MNFDDLKNKRFINEMYLNEEYKYLVDTFKIKRPSGYKGVFMPWDVIVDLGCNVGSFSFWSMSLARKIYGVDIDIDAVNMAKKLADKNKIRKVSFEHVGISDRSSQAWLEGSKGSVPMDGSWHLTYIPNRNAPYVYTESLNDFLKKRDIEKVDLLKVDVEGAEKVIFSALDFPRDKVKRIIGEYHGGFKPVESLERLGYRVTDFNVKRHFVAERK